MCILTGGGHGDHGAVLILSRGAGDLQPEPVQCPRLQAFHDVLCGVPPRREETRAGDVAGADRARQATRGTPSAVCPPRVRSWLPSASPARPWGPRTQRPSREWHLRPCPPRALSTPPAGPVPTRGRPPAPSSGEIVCPWCVSQLTKSRIRERRQPAQRHARASERGLWARGEAVAGTAARPCRKTTPRGEALKKRNARLLVAHRLLGAEPGGSQATTLTSSHVARLALEDDVGHGCQTPQNGKPVRGQRWGSLGSDRVWSQGACKPSSRRCGWAASRLLRRPRPAARGRVPGAWL